MEKSAISFNLSNPLAIKPKTEMVETTYGTRMAMPELVELEAVAFEGFLSVRREVIEEIGLPDPSYFIFYDDVDFAVRARRAGFRIWAVRDAVLVRQLDFDQQYALESWKGYFMYRNLFAVHLRYGDNALGALQALADHGDRRPAQPAARRAGRGPKCDPSHARRAGNAVAPISIRRLIHRVLPRHNAVIVNSQRAASATLSATYLSE